MHSLVVRTIGMSYSVEMCAQAGLDLEPLLADLTAAHGVAVAGVGRPTEAVLVDRRARSWDELLSDVERWVRDHGYVGLAWSRNANERGRSATLRFED